MATRYEEIEIWVLVNEVGDYVASDDADLLNERFEECIGDVSDQQGLRRVKVTLKVPVPTVLEVSGEVAVSEECGELKVTI